MALSRFLPFAVLTAAVTVAACSKNQTTTTGPTTCTTSAGTPSTSAFGPEGGTGSVAVTAGTGCAWTAASNANFITISQGTAGTGNGTVQFTVAANTGAERTGNLAIAGATITITQRAAAPVTPVTLSAPVPQSPVGGQTVDSARPQLIVTNSTATGNAGTVTYRFEISDLSSFPAEPARTFSVDGIAQGSGTTTGVVPRDLGPAVLWYWHARATNGTVTSAYSATETFRTPSTCSYTLSATTVSIGGSGGTTTITVTTDPTCAWTATSNASFLTITSGTSGTGNGSVTFTTSANSGAARSGTLTIAGVTVTVSQSGGAPIVAQFRLIDPANQPGATTECQIRSLTSASTTCRLESTSFPLGSTGLVNFSWTVQYIYGPDTKNLSQNSSSSTFSFMDTCGGPTSTNDGFLQPLSVTLTVTDSAGNTATVTSGQGGQPALFVRLFTCGV